MLRNKDGLDSILQPNDAGTVRDNHMQIRCSLCEDAFDGEPIAELCWAMLKR